ncbi:uncharacterized protein K452DRAFT_110925 [Aplosporella prunicola CBS 121167]|uniref:Uncharacterized protein n=1 Tax=Aplosporella prunicola CBS 121167 TaxID=1176127 RepID=A0A6A6B2D9_9PEZI|nr:uncharacterized protein K452DRAFT_110925 [Aplosporella prunicola CBS 121167]KAF2137425.1 hypothetical protein K452DRAFT_110925 [Aplosporella prunicola CBS 121167]
MEQQNETKSFITPSLDDEGTRRLTRDSFLSIPLHDVQDSAETLHNENVLRTETLPVKAASKPNNFQRFGIELVITNIIAVVLLLGAFSALTFLWFGGDANVNWRKVMLNGWIGQAVTLSTIAIRLAVSIQAGTAVAMLASTSLEPTRNGVLLRQAASLSLMRNTNTGPITSLWPFWKDFRWGKKYLGVFGRHSTWNYLPCVTIHINTFAVGCPHRKCPWICRNK